MSAWTARAPGKVNLCLFLGGGGRPDGRHELASVVEPLSLADELVLLPAPAGTVRDEVVCPGVAGPNLAAAALAAYREATGWDAPPQRLEIEKRVPVAAGMGGGSSDAAAALRLAAHAAGRPDDERLPAIAFALGADVPALLAAEPALAWGAGEHVERLPALAPHAMLVLPASEPLSTAAVFAEADRLGLGRPADELAARLADARAWARAGGPPDGALLVNDLEPATLALAPAVGQTLADARTAGADHVLVAGSGPTVAGVFFGDDAEMRAAVAAAGLRDRHPGAVVAVPADPALARPRPLA
jgi:4-diphosphocytidyl-2-C-methyl-D-erythritol kinase